jgi:hypothetical protein
VALWRTSSRGRESTARSMGAVMAEAVMAEVVMAEVVGAESGKDRKRYAEAGVELARLQTQGGTHSG